MSAGYTEPSGGAIDDQQGKDDLYQIVGDGGNVAVQLPGA
jgi:hypothetical protein